MTSNDQAIVRRFSEAQDHLVTQASDLSLETVARMVADKSIDTAPVFQRRERWNVKKQSALIESFILNVPVPPIYLMEDDYGNYSVIDGKQRITAIGQFMSGKLALSSLDSFPSLNGRRFKTIPRPLQNALSVRPYLRVITLLKQSDPNLKYEVFRRLNEGGEPLNPQELRNVIFRGPLNKAIYDLSNHEFLHQQLKIRNDRSSAFEKMEDAEFVLRFLMLRERWQHFSGDFRQSMDDFMMRHKEDSVAALEEPTDRFRSAINSCKIIWGKHAFKRHTGNSWRDQMLAGLYDAEMVAVDAVSKKTLSRALDERKTIVLKTIALFKDPEFDESVRRGTNTPARLQYRVRRMIEMLKCV